MILFTNLKLFTAKLLGNLTTMLAGNTFCIEEINHKGEA
jgi:hypothetical protein